MRIATWNVNSVRAHLQHTLDFLTAADIDVLALQETKCTPEKFPVAAFNALGYEVVSCGYDQWNGVAFASRLPISDVEYAFAGQPGFGEAGKLKPGQRADAAGLPVEARALGVTVADDVKLWSLYVPNGRDITHPHYDYKLCWLETLLEQLQQQLAADPEQILAIMGDFNICPLPEDCNDPNFAPGISTHVSVPEREIFSRFTRVLHDVVRPYAPTGFTYWDYRGASFARDIGFRIDYILGSDAFAQGITDAYIAREERGKQQPSDHVPVVCELNLELARQAGAEGVADDPPFFM